MTTTRWIATALALAVATCLSPVPARADLQIGRFSLEFRNSNYNLKTGDIVLTGGVSGKGPDGDFRADRAFGNREKQEITLVGGVQAHRKSGTQPITLRSDTAFIDERAKTYVASGNASAQVGQRIMNADEMRFDDAAHVFTLSGSVSIVEPPGRTLLTGLLIYHDDTGDISSPGPLSGIAENGDFRADRAQGNVRTNLMTLSGGVVLHSGAVASGPSKEPIALYADTLHIDGAAKRMQASGDVRIEQGTQTLSAPQLDLDNATGEMRMSGGVHGAQPPDRTFDTAEISYNLNSGEITVPKAVRGTSRNGDFSAGSAHGNLKAHVYDLVGDAVVHSSGKATKGTPTTPTTLSAQHIHIDEANKSYRAEGGAEVAQGDRTVSAPLMTFDDKIHVVKMTGGVHATQLPNRSADTAEVIYHSDSGDVSAPAHVSGRSPTDSFSADRALGNTKKNVYDLLGNVVLRRQNPTDKDPSVMTASDLHIDGNAKTYTATGNPKVTQGPRTMTGKVISLNDTTHLMHVSGGVHVEAPQGRSFNTPELTYNLQSDDFKMLGGITALFPLGKPSPTPTPFASPSSDLAPQAPSPFANGGIPSQFASPAPSPSPTASPPPTIAPSPSAAPH